MPFLPPLQRETQISGCCLHKGPNLAAPMEIVQAGLLIIYSGLLWPRIHLFLFAISAPINHGRWWKPLTHLVGCRRRTLRVLMPLSLKHGSAADMPLLLVIKLLFWIKRIILF